MVTSATTVPVGSGSLAIRTDEPGSSAATRLPGLDGLRGLAVVAVLVFHLWPRVLPGGFIGVSVFFTLSGFVITRALLGETRQRGTVRFRAFWGRRLRRLWPASAVTLAVVVLIWFAAQWMTRGIASDVGAAFAQVSNWRFLLTGQAYGANELSPVAHFWSLSIEEQLYLVVPLVVWLGRKRPGAVLAGFVVLLFASLGTTVANAGNAPVVYFSTFTRAAELLAGGILAVVATRLPQQLPKTWARVVGVAGGLSLLALGWLCVRTSLGTSAYYRGGLSGLAVLSVAVILAGAYSPGFARVVAVRPLLWLGTVSYGVYLIHWPLHVALEHTGIPRWMQPWIVVMITLILAALSLQLLELPVRERRVSKRIVRPVALALTAVIIGGTVIGLAVAPPASAIDFGAATARFDRQGGGSSTPRVGPIGTPTNPARTAVFGDSTALMVALGLGGGDRRILPIGGAVDLGCPIGRGGLVRGSAAEGDDPTMIGRAPRAECAWDTAWRRFMEQRRGADVAIILGGNWDIAGRRIPELGDRWFTIGDPTYDRWLRDELAGAADALRGAGARQVLWLTLPPNRGRGMNARVEAFNAFVREIAATRPWIVVADYAGYLRSGETDARLRPDGIHLSADTSKVFSREWLNERILALATSGSSGR